jgi:peptidoglycan hydrolase-like protein with peptidoglycan-binding domain
MPRRRHPIKEELRDSHSLQNSGATAVRGLHPSNVSSPSSIAVLSPERIVMRNLKVIGSTIVISCLGLMSACALEPDADNPSQQTSDEQAISDPSAAEDPSAPSDADDAAVEDAITPFATPTCNWVASFAGAWVPFRTGANTVNCNMVRGDNSAGVRQLQHSMNVCYGEHLVEDGDFGGNTRAALLRTQIKVGAAADGEYGPNTRRAMLHEGVNGGCVRVP